MSNKLFKLADLFEKKVRKFAQDAQNEPQKLEPNKPVYNKEKAILEALKPQSKQAILDLKVEDRGSLVKVKFHSGKCDDACWNDILKAVQKVAPGYKLEEV